MGEANVEAGVLRRGEVLEGQRKGKHSNWKRSQTRGAGSRPVAMFLLTLSRASPANQRIDEKALNLMPP